MSPRPSTLAAAALLAGVGAFGRSAFAAEPLASALATTPIVHITPVAAGPGETIGVPAAGAATFAIPTAPTALEDRPVGPAALGDRPVATWALATGATPPELLVAPAPPPVAPAPAAEAPAPSAEAPTPSAEADPSELAEAAAPDPEATPDAEDTVPAEASVPASPPVAPSADIAYDGSAADFLAATNACRAEAGLAPLVANAELTAYAAGHVATMSAEDHLYHSDISVLLQPWWMVGENVGIGPTVSAIQEALVASPTHYANLADAAYTHVGIAVLVDAAGRTWTAHVFGV